jgi:6,7-dimethyl-8-ribityllumazine synthase
MNNIKQLKIAVVTSRFNATITKNLQNGVLEYLKNHGVLAENIQTYEVPGAIEIPITAQAIANLQQHHAIIALGAVIRGETSHYDWVCQQVSLGCQRVALDLGIPVVFGVLTTDTEMQAMDRIGGKHGHKGHEAAATAIEMANLIQQIGCKKTNFRGFL